VPTNIAVTKKMIFYAKGHEKCLKGAIDVPPVSLINPFWGTGKQQLAWRVSGHLHAHGKPVRQSKQKTPELVAALFPAPEPKYAVRSDYHAIHNSGRRPLSAVHLIVLHDMEVALYDEAAEAVGRYFESKASGGSTNYGVDNNSIQCYLQDSIIPWGAPYANTAGLHIEQMGKASWTDAEWKKLAAGTLDRTAWLIAQKSKKLGIPIRRLTDEQVKAGSKGVTTHRQCTRVFHVYGGHTDPGTGFPYDEILETARAYL